MLIAPLAAAVLLAMTLPAFRAYFFGEAFLYLGQYWAAGHDFWRALASPSDIIFFKPVCFAASLPWYFLLPLDPTPYHLRNFVLSAVNLVLLHRILVRLVVRPWVRVLALLLFTVSKVHLTTIGYLMIFDSIVVLFFLLLSVLFALRWCVERRRRDYVLALLSCGLCVFTKDYAVVAVGVVLVAVVTQRGGRVATAWVAPLAVLAAGRIALRYMIAGPMPWWHPVYAPALSVVEVIRKGVILLSAVTNTSVAWHDKTGASGIGSVIAALSARLQPVTGRLELSEWIDGIACVAFLVLLALTVARSRPARCAVAFGGTWVLAFFVAPIFVRNLQIYYVYESLAGLAVLLGVILDHASRRLLMAWTVAVAAIGVAGAASNARALYDWQYAADSARKIEVAVLQAYRGRPLQSMTLVTADPFFWRWVLTADGKAPMIETLLDRPGLRVSVLDRSDTAMLPVDLDDTHVVLDADAGFVPLRLDPDVPP